MFKDTWDKIKIRLEKKALKGQITYFSIIGVLLLLIGLFMLIDAFYAAFGLVTGLIYLNESWIVRLAYLIIIAVMGGFLVSRATEIIGMSRLVTTIFVIIGLFLLVFSFLTARVLVEIYYQLSPFTMIGVFFFVVMVTIALYILGKGIAKIIQVKNLGKT